MMRICRNGGPLAFVLILGLGAAAGGCASASSDGTAGEVPSMERETAGESRFSRCSEGMENGGSCISLRYVTYRDESGDPVLTAAQAQDNIDAINRVWDQCRIQFQIDDFFTVDPSKANLNYNTSSDDELNDIRMAFKPSKSLLVVNTGEWSGSLGEGSANAWTMMPGSAPYGAILEGSVATYPNIIAHELGHYLGLDHADDTARLMNPVIYNESTELTEEECSNARKSARGIWAQALR